MIHPLNRRPWHLARAATRHCAVAMGLLLCLAAALASPPAAAGELSGRAGRLVDAQGPVSLYDTETGQWDEALRNRALTEGDRLSTGRGARAELRVGSTELRMGAGTEVEFVRLDDERMVFQLWRGNLAVRVRSREIASEIEVITREGRVMPERAGHFRVDREDDTTWASVWRGGVRVQTPDQRFDVAAGRRVELYFQSRDGSTVVSWSAAVADAFADAVARDEQHDERSVSHRYVSPEMTGVEDLDRHGRWERHPEFGMVWSPLSVALDWAPFRHGRWVWHVRWGWTWVDAAPWGFAPFHYGRWVQWGSRWVWSPGVWVHRPAFAPALVNWGPSPGVSVSITLGRSTPPAYWTPLPLRQPYVPPFVHGPRYGEAVNRPHLAMREPVMSAPGHPVAVAPLVRPVTVPAPVPPSVRGPASAAAPVYPAPALTGPITVSPGAVAAPQARPVPPSDRATDPREGREVHREPVREPGRGVNREPGRGERSDAQDVWRENRREGRRDEGRAGRQEERREARGEARPQAREVPGEARREQRREGPREDRKEDRKDGARQDDRRPQLTDMRPRDGRERQSLL